MTTTAHERPGFSARARDLLGRALPPALLWAALNGGDRASWTIGLPVVVAATWLAGALAPPRRVRWRWRHVPSFFVWFVRESLGGGVDVARLAWRGRRHLSPATLVHDTRLPTGAPRLLFCAVVSLLPGTLVYAIDNDRVHVHALAASPDVAAALHDLEERIAMLLVVEREVPQGGGT